MFCCGGVACLSCEQEQEPLAELQRQAAERGTALLVVPNDALPQSVADELQLKVGNKNKPKRKGAELFFVVCTRGNISARTLLLVLLLRGTGSRTTALLRVLSLCPSSGRVLPCCPICLLSLPWSGPRWWARRGAGGPRRPSTTARDCIWTGHTRQRAYSSHATGLQQTKEKGKKNKNIWFGCLWLMFKQGWFVRSCLQLQTKQAS
jgi:hypothetical protein